VFSKEAIRGKLGKDLLKPTVIYVRPVLDLIRKYDVRGIAHITGGGFRDNIIRILPRGVEAIIYRGLWPVLPIFNTIREKGDLEYREMFNTFNMGIGMALVIPRKEIHEARHYLLEKYRLSSWIIGEVIRGVRNVEVV
jgi:phosphoribosylformylglycinamidine cyclo-ligase